MMLEDILKKSLLKNWKIHKTIFCVCLNQKKVRGLHLQTKDSQENSFL